MQPWVKRILQAGFVFVAVWLLVIYYWRSSMHMPTFTDAVLYLVLAPAVLLSAVFLIRKMSSGLAAVGAAANFNLNARTNTIVAADEQSAQIERDWTLSIVAGNAITRYGQSVGELHDAVTAKQTRFELDAELLDANGYPPLSGRIANLEVMPTFSLFDQWEAANCQTVNCWEPEDKRAIVLAHDIFMGLIGPLLQHPQLSDSKTSAGASTHATDQPDIYLVAVLPNRWTKQQKQAVTLWFADLISQQGWPAEKFFIHPLSLDKPTVPYIVLDKLNVQMNRQDISGLYVFMASQSFLGGKIFTEQQTDRPFCSAQDKTWIPGEAAAGLVLTNAIWATRLTMQTLVSVHRATHQMRDKSADECGKIKPDTLIAVIQGALQHAAVDAEKVAAVSADTDARANRTVELMAALNELMPDMDPVTACFRLEADCGALGAVAGLAALLNGMQRVIEKGDAVLCVSNNDSFERSAVVLNAGEHNRIN